MYLPTRSEIAFHLIAPYETKVDRPLHWRAVASEGGEDDAKLDARQQPDAISCQRARRLRFYGEPGEIAFHLRFFFDQSDSFDPIG